MFEIFIKAIDAITPEENAQIDETSSLAYSAPDGGMAEGNPPASEAASPSGSAPEGGQAPEDGDDIEWSNPSWWVMGRLDGRIVSLVGVLTREIQVGGQAVLVSGIGGVATHPDYQRRGLAGALMQRAAVFMREELHAPFGLLVCSDHRVHYYAKFGWQLLRSPMLFDHREKKDVFEGNVMVLPLADIPWPEGTVDLRGLPW